MEQEIEKSRKESFDRLKRTKSRLKDETPFWEYVINHFPFSNAHIFKWCLKMAGVRVGKHVKLAGRIKVKLRGKPSNIIIEDYVTLGKNVDLRNRENGKIILRTMCYLDDNVRIVAAREGIVEISSGAEIGRGTIINSGGITKVGEYAVIAGYANINASSHGIAKSLFIKDQPHEHGYVTIGRDVWFGGYITVAMNTTIGEGAVIGANSFVKGEIPPFSVCVGSPAKVLKYRN